VEPLRERRVFAGRRFSWVEVVLSSSGELAWLTGGRVLFARGGGRARVVARNATDGLALEDDRTLRWFSYSEALDFFDLRPWRGRGCPRRERYREVAASEAVVVTEAYYDDSYHIVRACVRRNRNDPVIAQFIAIVDGDYGEVLGATGRWVAIRKLLISRYEGCVLERVVPFDAVAHERGRAAEIPACDSARRPQKEEPVVVTQGGVPAWIVRTPDRSAVFATGPEPGSVVELDAAGPGGITGLVADGRLVRWLHDGVPRVADLE
jgi:hypothetical protein